MLDKYYPHKIKEYHNFQIVDDFRNNKINESIVFLQNTDFIDYFEHKFKQNNIRNNFFKFNQEELKSVFDYLNIFKPINNLQKTIKQQEFYKCNLCNRSFCSLIYLNNHMEICKGLSCPICNKTFASKQTYLNHTKNCGQFKCEFCKSVFNSKFKFNKHLNTCIKISKKKDTTNQKLSEKKDTILEKPISPDTSIINNNITNDIETNINNIETNINDIETNLI